MSVWISDMDIPDSCSGCQFSYVNKYNERKCSRTEACCDLGLDGRDIKCPMHYVPSNHGGLIDVEDVRSFLMEKWVSPQADTYNLHDMMRDLCEFEIIIPEERS